MQLKAGTCFWEFSWIAYFVCITIFYCLINNMYFQVHISCKLLNLLLQWWIILSLKLNVNAEHFLTKKNDSYYIFFKDLFIVSGLCIKWCLFHSCCTSLCIYHIVISDCGNLKVRWWLPVARCSFQVFRKPTLSC
jgi:hypothetical protein